VPFTTTSPTYQSPLWVRTLFAALLGWVLGAALQLQQSKLDSVPFYGSFMALAGVFIVCIAIKNIAIRKRMPIPGARGWQPVVERVVEQVVILLALAALGFAVTGLRAVAFAQHTLEPALEGRDLLVTGVVANLPQRNELALRFQFAVESSQWAGPAGAGHGAAHGSDAPRLPPLIQVGWYGGVGQVGPVGPIGPTSTTDMAQPAPPQFTLARAVPAVQAGERWRLTLRLKAPHGARNPGGFDYELWLWEQGVQATGYVRTSAQDAPPQRLDSGGVAAWRYGINHLRQSAREAIAQRIDNRQQAGLIAALVMGDQSAIDRADWDVFRATGVAHLVSISGLHITMLAWAGAWLVAGAWRRSARLCSLVPVPQAALWGSVLVALAYSAFAGWGVPAQRTCLMLASVAALRLAGARWPWPLVWMLACAVVVAADPWALLQAGFWLSFVAVGILFATNFIAKEAINTSARGINEPKSIVFTPKIIPRSATSQLWAKARSAMQAVWHQQWTLTVALAPLTLLWFGQISAVGLLANMLAIPWVTLVITPLALLGTLVPLAWDVAALAVAGMLQVLQWMATWPGAALSVAAAPWAVGVVASAGGFLAVAALPWAWRIWSIPLLLPLLLWQAPRPPDGGFELLAADVGQGNAVLVRTAHHALMFDTGPRFSLESDAGHRMLVPLLHHVQEKLDMVVLSHRDIDHVGGAPAVLAMQPQAQLLSSLEADHSLQSLRPAQRCEAGQRWVWDGVQFEILHPQAADYQPPARSNALSCVLRVSHGDKVALLAGDIEWAQEQQLLARAAPLKANVLLVPHHGSNTSSSAEFLDAVAPQVAIVQSGYRNRFGHPAAPVLARYAQRGIRVVDSPHCGAYTWQSWKVDATQDDATLGSCWRRDTLRYWHHAVP
jgi:competence protein ComEC